MAAVLGIVGGIIQTMLQNSAQKKIANLQAATQIQQQKMSNATDMAKQGNELQQRSSENNIKQWGDSADRQTNARSALISIFQNAAKPFGAGSFYN